MGDDRTVIILPGEDQDKDVYKEAKNLRGSHARIRIEDPLEHTKTVWLEFISKISKMGSRTVIIVPRNYDKESKRLRSKFVRVFVTEIPEKEKE
jgi:hypothetical protein